VFSTAEANQTSVDIHILQGERTMAGDNKSLGTFRLEGIPPAPRGIPKIEVTFDIDANGIINVSAKDMATNKAQNITITSSTNLADDEIEKMVKDAEQFAEADKKRKEAVEQRNSAEQLAYSAEQQLADLGDKVDETLKTQANEQINALRDALKAENDEQIKSAFETLQKTVYEISTKAYEAQAAEGNTSDAGQPQAAAPAEEDGVIDAEFRPSDEGVGAGR
jgi:molecular chaperone DnaK